MSHRALIASLALALLGCDGSAPGADASVADASAFDAGRSAVDASAPDAGGGELPLLAVEDLEVAGAFRLPAMTFGESDLNFAVGTMALSESGETMFIVGHSHQQAIAEFRIPELVQSETLSELNMADPPIQPFARVLTRVDNPQAISSITGMWVEDGALILNAIEYYDAPADNTHTTLVLRDASDLAGSSIDGFYGLEARAHGAGWLSPIPEEHRELLGGAMITGLSSGHPIISRLSVGPSAHLVSLDDIVSGVDPIPTTALLDYSLAAPLHPDLSNDEGDNDLWTHLSRAVFGFVVPGTRTYATFGYSGGHGPRGVCYKCVPDGLDSECAGYCSRDPEDRSLRYWFFDLNDLAAVRAGELAPSDVRPYAHGPFESPFVDARPQMGGGAWDAERGLLYLTMTGADREQGTYSNPPVVVAYRLR